MPLETFDEFLELEQVCRKMQKGRILKTYFLQTYHNPNLSSEAPT